MLLNSLKPKKIELIKNISFFIIPIFLYITLTPYVNSQKDLIFITLLFTTIIFFAFEIVPQYFASLIFLFTSFFFSLAPKELIFSGFSSSAFWLVFSGILLATAIKNTNLTDKLLNLFLKTKNPNFFVLLFNLSILGFLFSFLMPSGVTRVALLIPIGIAITKIYNFEEKSNGYIAILLTLILSTTIPAFSILPANVPNIILSGLSNQIYNYEILYSHYLLTNFLVLGIVKNFIITLLIYFLFKDTIQNKTTNIEKTKITKEQKIILFTLFFMVFFWLTDFLHHLSPTIIAICGVLFLAHPSINIIKAKDLNLNFAPLIFIVTIISLGNISSENLFIKEFLSLLLSKYDFSAHSEFINYLVLNITISFSGLLLTQATIPAIFTPIAHEISILSGFSLNEIFMIEVSAFSNLFFPFQMPPLVIGLALANIQTSKMVKILIYLFLANIIFLLPLQYFWMKI